MTLVTRLLLRAPVKWVPHTKIRKSYFRLIIGPRQLCIMLSKSLTLKCFGVPQSDFLKVVESELYVLNGSMYNKWAIFLVSNTNIL